MAPMKRCRSECNIDMKVLDSMPPKKKLYACWMLGIAPSERPTQLVTTHEQLVKDMVQKKGLEERCERLTQQTQDLHDKVAKLTDELETERGYIQQHVRKLIFRASSPAGKLEDDMSEESGSGSSAHSRTRSGTS